MKIPIQVEVSWRGDQEAAMATVDRRPFGDRQEMREWVTIHVANGSVIGFWKTDIDRLHLAG
jgi:hypothetical protein